MDQRQLLSLIAAGAIAEIVIHRDPPGWGLTALGPDLPGNPEARLRVRLHTARTVPRVFKTLDAAAAMLGDLGWKRPATLDAGL
jgi:hypothetical protein